MILLYLEGSGSKFQSANTKISYFSHFWIPGVEKTHVNTKTRSIFPIFLIPGVEKETCQHQASQFSTFFGFQELRKKLERGNTKGR